MIKLYFAPGACSLSPHIVLSESGIPFELEQVNLGTKITKSGANFKTINPKGAVPTLQLDNGQILTEGAVIVQYIADLKPESKLLPASGTMERYRVQELLNYIGSDIHKGFSPLFNPKTPEEYKTMAKEQLYTRFDYLNTLLEKKQFLTGSGFCVADAYLFTVLRWTGNVGIDLSRWPNLVAFMGHMSARPAVQRALAAEGLK